MINWTFLCFGLALLFGMLGFTGFLGSYAFIAELLFVGFIIMAVVTAILESPPPFTW